MSRECAFLSNFDGMWFVAQFLPITPQLVILTPLDTRTRTAKLKPPFSHAFDPFEAIGKLAKDCGLRRRYHFYGLERRSTSALSHERDRSRTRWAA
ncbi:MAG: hypothetical protein FD138_366 [Planctomycetota bacterium]|nr:MAG: hypothetical protein FD138_366 [Planctomycetota bacterium]